MFGFLNKLFGGSKSEKDIKKLSPEVEKSNSFFTQLQGLSNDQLRAKTTEFKQRIQEHTANINTQINDTKSQAEAQTDIYAKEDIYKQVDALYLERNKQIEEILNELLPEAFAVVKEAASRFTNNVQLFSTATDLDRELATKKAYVKIEGDQSVFNNNWLAAGGQVQWNMVHYDVQLIGGTVLHQGKIAEMATGEGKTLVSTLPVYLNALAGLGVHLVTVNDYLARRDSEWNGTLFEWLGLTVDCIDKHQPNSEERRLAYLADITYGTNNEFGFDYLRDNMVHNPSEMVQRKHHFAIVDEVDSVLIDDARTPLIISGPVPRGDEQEFQLLKPRIEKLIEAQKRIATDSLVQAKKLIAEGKDDKDAGGLMLYRAYKALPKHGSLIKYLSEPGIKQILQKTENYYLGEQQRNMPIVDGELYFTIDEKNNSVDLTQKGLQLLSSASADSNFFVLPDISVLMNNIDTNASLNTDEKTAQKAVLLQEYSVKADRIHTVQQLLKAYTLFDIDVDYVVMDEKVKIVDEQTGRILDGRRYSDGLHQAIEAKENVTIEAATQTFATITLQNYFRMYHKLAGMTGTAETEAAELWSIYKLDVVKVPTNIPIKRNDQEDLIYKTKREKYRAIIDEVKELSAAGRPVLVGTTNVEVSELLSKMLTFEKIDHNVLNAKQHAREAEIVSGAGLTSAITIATNMAGRGTDIKLASEVKNAGGLAIIGTERHDSRRVDRQLRGRAGRQGDPGSSKFYISLEDELMRLFGSERLSGIMDKLGHKDGDVIQHSMITKSIERAQKKVEENNFGIRKRLLEYDDVMNAQRDVIYKRRKNALFGDRLSIDIENAFADVATDVATSYAGSNAYADYKMDCIRLFALEPTITEQAFLSASADNLTDSLYSDLKNFYHYKSKAIVEQTYPVLSGIRGQNPNQQIDNVSIPFTDGVHGFNALANLDSCLQPNSLEVMNALERSATLALIDDGWKNHLRQMDELKQSVQMSSSTEQKDPLVIYKIEAFNLFKQLISATNKNIVSFLCKANLPVHNQQDIHEAEEQHTDMRNLRTSHEEFGDDTTERDEMYDTREPVKQEPIKREEPKIGRNDNCPCGSGKKFKACHGKGM